MDTNSPRPTLLRYTFYTIAIFAVLHGLEAVTRHGRWGALHENGPVEWLQFGLLLASASVLAWTARSCARPAREPGILLAGMAGFASLRELDDVLDTLVPVLGWKVAFALLLFALVRAVRFRGRFIEGVAGLVRAPAFALFWAGFIIAIPLAQLLGHGPFLQALMGENYVRAYKQVIEESAELIGYMLVLAAAIEYRANAGFHGPIEAH